VSATTPLELTLRLVEATTPVAAGGRVLVTIDGPDDIDHVRRWTTATGNTLLTVHPDAVEVVRGRIADPIDALAPEQRPGHRLWIYTNFHCNLACDYCCVASSPRADPRALDLDRFEAIVDEARVCGFAEIYLTGGEPFLLLDLDARIRVAAAMCPTTILTNGMVWTGERRRRLEALPRENVTLQISLDSASAPLHDQHRGAGSFARAHDGIRLALDLGFRVRVSATLGADAGCAERELTDLFDDLGLGDDQRVIRRVARQGPATDGLSVSRASLVPEVCVHSEGIAWHPVAATDPSMQVAPAGTPLSAATEAIRDEYRQYRIAGDIVASTFPCA
jgi:pyruvate-formate lyase-activating enzyme